MENIVTSSNTPQKRNPSVAALMEEMNPVVTVKEHFACRDKSKVVA